MKVHTWSSYQTHSSNKKMSLQTQIDQLREQLALHSVLIRQFLTNKECETEINFPIPMPMNDVSFHDPIPMAPPPPKCCAPESLPNVDDVKRFFNVTIDQAKKQYEGMNASFPVKGCTEMGLQHRQKQTEQILTRLVSELKSGLDHFGLLNCEFSGREQTLDLAQLDWLTCLYVNMTEFHYNWKNDTDKIEELTQKMNTTFKSRYGHLCPADSKDDEFNMAHHVGKMLTLDYVAPLFFTHSKLVQLAEVQEIPESN